jgi:hypothetical protein
MFQGKRPLRTASTNHFGALDEKKTSRDAHNQFILELFLFVAEVLI